MKIQSRRQKNILKIGYIFLGIVLLSSLFSKTFSKLMLTRVSVALPKSGPVIKTFSGEGSAEFRDSYKLFAPIDIAVSKIFVRNGDQVKVGQKLYSLDITKLKNEISEMEIKRAIRETTLQALAEKKQSLQLEKQDLEERSKSNQKNALLLELDQKISQCDSKIKKAEGTLKMNEELFSEQLISQDELDEATQSLIEAKNEKEKLLLEKRDKALEYEKQLRSYEEDIKELTTQIETEELNLKLLDLEYAQKAEIIKTSGIVTAKEEGVIIDLKLEEGAPVGEGQELLSIGLYKSGYLVKIPLSKEIDFIGMGDEVIVSIPSKHVFDIKGQVAAIRKKEDGQEVEITFSAEELQGGERVKIKLEKNLGEFDVVIPYSAIVKEHFKSYVFIVKKEDNPLGQSYTVQKKPIYIEAFNEEYAAIREGVDFLDWVVTSSKKEIQNGEKVNVENENDVLKENK